MTEDRIDVGQVVITRRIKFWCCPDCGARFYRTPTEVSNTNHCCPVNPNVITVVTEPYESEVQ